MSHPNEPLKVDPTELRMTADQLAGDASGFQAAHRSAQTRASKAALGTGSSAAALPAMVAAWDADGARFGEHFASYVQAHRAAADGYLRTDDASADEIDDAGAAP